LAANSNANSPIQSFHEFSSDFTKSLISQIYSNIYTEPDDVSKKNLLS